MSGLPIVPPLHEPPPGGVPGGPATPPAATALPELRDEDLHDLLVAFYDAVAEDELLAPYFAAVDMAEHIPRIADFWSTLVFQTGRYQGNAFRPHMQMEGLTAEHFARWVATLVRTVDDRYTGAAAGAVKDYGHRVAYSMQLRLGLQPFTERRTLPQRQGDRTPQSQSEHGTG